MSSTSFSKKLRQRPLPAAVVTVITPDELQQILTDFAATPEFKAIGTLLYDKTKVALENEGFFVTFVDWLLFPDLMGHAYLRCRFTVADAVSKAARAPFEGLCMVKTRVTGSTVVTTELKLLFTDEAIKRNRVVHLAFSTPTVDCANEAHPVQALVANLLETEKASGDHWAFTAGRNFAKLVSKDLSM